MNAQRDPVSDWATDFDHLDPAWGTDQHAIFDDLRERCPVAHTDRFHGAYLVTRYDDVAAVAYDTEHFSSRTVIVNESPADEMAGIAPPITSDPPDHSAARRMLLPAFAPRKIDGWESITRQICRDVLDGLDSSGTIDAATQYAQHIPVLVIAQMLGLPDDDGDRFRVWLHELLEVGPAEPEVGARAFGEIYGYLRGHIEQRRAEPADDLLGFLLGLEQDGEPLTTPHIIGTATLLLLAGIDTTWSSIGSSIWHLARNPSDRERLVSDPALMPSAVEELLRAYAPVIMARYVASDTELSGVPLCAGQRVLLPFPAANRDPSRFTDADQVIIDRVENRHVTFGLGIHRCLGSNLARMELRVALEEWLVRFPNFELADPDAVTWSVGQIRGPRRLPIRIG